MKIETVAVHAGHTIDLATGAVSAPIHLSTTFERDVEGGYSRGFMYTRNNNPNRQALEQGISALEGGAGAAAFGSGTGATMAIFQAMRPGDHVLAHVDAYYGTSRLLRHERPGCRQKGASEENKTRLDGNALKSAPEDRRHCSGHADRSRRRSALCLRQYMGSGVAAPVRSRRRP